jgi:2-keto-3-deoxy-L-rhamnonate aldolase RhmA
VLDIGAQAIIVPLVNTAEQAEAGVRALKYPPIGIRGAGLARAQGYGEAYSASYFKDANDQTMFIAQVEDAVAVHNIDAILAVEGLDAVFLGTLDLSGSLGHLGQTDHPDVEKAHMRVLEACLRAGKAAGIMTMSPEQATQRIGQGFRMIGMGIDVDSLLSLAKESARRVNKSVAK